jgi:iron complex transport system substrate-binding protein
MGGPARLPLMNRRLACLLILLAIGAPMAAIAAIQVTDDSGAQLTLAAPASRIVSLTPGATEMLFAAGAGDHLIATVEYSDIPAEAKRVPRIGDVVSVDIERLVAAHPDVVVIWPGGGNAAEIQKVAKLGIPLYAQEVGHLADLPDSIRRLGRLAGTLAVAERSAQDLATRLARLSQQHEGANRLTALLQVWNRPLYTVGAHQLMTDALRLCGVRNVFGDLNEPGPAVDVEAVLARNPDIIIAAAPPGEAAGWLADWKRFPRLKAVRSGRLIAFEDVRFSRLGPSVVEATEALCRLISP